MHVWALGLSCETPAAFWAQLISSNGSSTCGTKVSPNLLPTTPGQLSCITSYISKGTCTVLSASSKLGPNTSCPTVPRRFPPNSSWLWLGKPSPWVTRVLLCSCWLPSTLFCERSFLRFFQTAVSRHSSFRPQQEATLAATWRCHCALPGIRLAGQNCYQRAMLVSKDHQDLHQ